MSYKTVISCLGEGSYNPGIDLVQSLIGLPSHTMPEKPFIGSRYQSMINKDITFPSGNKLGDLFMTFNFKSSPKAMLC